MPDPGTPGQVVCNTGPLIALCKINHVMVDEKNARRVASTVYHLDVLGTGGLLLKASETVW
jgi:predicted nucleic acid-binding protein